MTNETIEMNATADNNIKTGLVLEGGALRGLYTMGILTIGTIAVCAHGSARATFSEPNLPITAYLKNSTRLISRRSKRVKLTFISFARMLKQVNLSIVWPIKICQ